MKITKRILNISALSLVLAEAILFVLIQTSKGNVYEMLAYLSVGISLAFALLTILLGMRGMLLRLGLALTLVADYFLILTEPINEEIGVFVFSLVQLAYFIALIRKAKSARERVVHISLRISLIALLMLVCIIVLGDRIDLLSILSAFYYANLLCNIIFAFVNLPYGLLFALGLLLLALCDLFLGLGFLGENYLGAIEGSFLWWISNSGLNIPWLFYVPSCTLISLSVYRHNVKS